MTAPRMASIVVNASDIEAVAGFWKGLLDVQERNRLPGFIWLERQEGTGVSLAVQQVDEPTPGRNRLHLDLGSPDLPATHERIVELGGSELEQHSIGDFGWTVFADPEGRPTPTTTPDGQGTGGDGRARTASVSPSSGPGPASR